MLDELLHSGQDSRVLGMPPSWHLVSLCHRILVDSVGAVLFIWLIGFLRQGLSILRSPGYSRTHYIDQTGHELTEIHPVSPEC